jgi:hypothetical protein
VSVSCQDSSVTSHKLLSSGMQKGKFAARLKANFEAYEMLYLLTVLKNDSMNMLGYEIFCDCCCHYHVNAQMSYCDACLHLSSLAK